MQIGDCNDRWLNGNRDGDTVSSAPCSLKGTKIRERPAQFQMWLPFHSGVSADGRMPVKLLRQPWGIVLEFPCKREKQETIVGFAVKLNVVFCPQPSGEVQRLKREIKQENHPAGNER